MSVKPKIEYTAKSVDQYRLHRLTWWQCFFTDLPFTVMIIALFLFMIVVYVKIGYPEVFIGFIGILAFVLERTKFWYEGGKILLETDDDSVRLSNGKNYRWGDIVKVDIPPLPVSQYGMPVPKYKVHFKDGYKFTIDQRLRGYTDLYLKLYKRGIEGADKALPIYFVDLSNGTAPGRLKPKPVAIYYPDKDIEVQTNLKSNESVRRKRKKPASR
ncbi:hypothetical protein [Gayadomonas joobiniege]|uniref:hypothetical protein n=1 Tax=Gayadomonas joobiniege TaxID=1234606 RepID=UPI0003713DFC|nr:hypothetical protein [Gayadomonas joobiniege]